MEATGSQIYFYWDMFMILNFIMNLFLIGMTGMLRRKYMVKKRLFLAALLGSIQMTGGMSICFLLSKKNPAWIGKVTLPVVLLAVITALEMLQVAFREKQIREILWDFWGMIQVSILTGGCLFFLREHINKPEHLSGVFILLGSLAVFVAFLVGLRVLGRREQENHVMDGILTAKDGKEYHLRVLYDTGNQLVSPYTGEAVMIIAKELVEQMEVEKTQNPLWIPYHSIGGDGLLPAYRFPRLTLQNGQIKEDFLAAASENISMDHTIQIILNG